ncbi:cytochrome P450 11B1 [Coprinopsis cinerea okayama7|uniref:Cytochrome P450 11B1 n=1 Tax=Coprinopsis cinerea (strain Okayama-7 / 130 / ATCC MYA-4618 / FGSC 9003) TaxID=240176 RepID=A8P6L8_COPC7|nr:cytochrome P450 11B1 [Coprinopsis cinerea okayama7\|eukprot:XP_001839182.2 cytochrome P450 11B1 [Coprinopsis cinerea okayama7\
MASNALLVVALTVTVVLVLYRALYNLFLSPLSAIPGPWYAAISNIWIGYHQLCLRQCKTVQSLFDTYGPVVRIGPNKVAFCDASAMRAVYSVYKFDKSTYYKGLVTMTTLDHATYSIRRKAYSPHYTPPNIAKFQPEVHEFTLQLVDILENIAGKASLECMALFRNLMVDVMTETLFGYRLGALGKWAMDAEDPLSTAINDFPKRGILRSVIPSWVWKLICRVPNNRWRQWCDSDNIMAEMNAGSHGEPERPTLLQRLLQHRYSAKQPVPDCDIISECMGHLIAGADTSSTTISYILWELSRRPDIVAKLQAELDEAIPDSRAIPDIAILQELPYLNGLIKEALRLYTAAPSLLERVVPSSSSKPNHQDEDFDLLGYALPAGTIVSTQAWSMHRNPAVYPSPESFLPERWLESSSASPDQLFQMHQHLMAFGAGVRVCGGQNLAQIVLRVVVAMIVRNFNVFAPEETNERSMEIKDSFVIFPAAMECKLIFKPRQQ